MMGAALRQQPAPWHPTLEVEMQSDDTRRERERAYHAARYAANPDAYKAKATLWKAANPDRVALSRAKYRETHKDEIKARNAAYHQANRERLQAHNAAYRAAHPEQQRARDARYRAAHADERRARSRAYYAANLERERVRQAAYRAADPEKFRAKAKARHALKRGATVCDLTRQQWDAIKAAYGYRCAYCGARTLALTQDHLIPLSKGGGHTVTNIVPACKPCNSRKKDGPPRAPVQPLLLA